VQGAIRRLEGRAGGVGFYFVKIGQLGTELFTIEDFMYQIIFFSKNFRRSRWHHLSCTVAG